MSKRNTVLKVLKHQLSEVKRGLKYSSEYEDLTDVLGGNYDDKAENQFRINCKKDIEELEFVIWCLKSKSAIQEMFGEFKN